MTGAPMPEGADAVVMVEDARREGDRVVLDARQAGRAAAPAGSNRAARCAGARSCSAPATGSTR